MLEIFDADSGCTEGFPAKKLIGETVKHNLSQIFSTFGMPEILVMVIVQRLIPQVKLQI